MALWVTFQLWLILALGTLLSLQRLSFLICIMGTKQHQPHGIGLRFLADPGPPRRVLINDTGVHSAPIKLFGLALPGGICSCGFQGAAVIALLSQYLPSVFPLQ
jgi:hypothetical protein